jgi:hypothetical protein
LISGLVIGHYFTINSFHLNTNLPQLILPLHPGLLPGLIDAFNAGLGTLEVQSSFDDSGLLGRFPHGMDPVSDIIPHRLPVRVRVLRRLPPGLRDDKNE